MLRHTFFTLSISVVCIALLPLVNSAQLRSIPTNDGDTDRIIAKIKPFEELARQYSAAECPKLDCTKAQDIHVRLRDARIYMRYAYYWNKRAADSQMELGFNLFAAECSGQTVNGHLAFKRATKVLYHFGDSSVPPQYHRSYTIAVTKSDAKLVVDSYGDIINETRINITEKQFNGILETIRASKIAKRKALNDNDGCTGGTSESLEIFEGARVLFDADVYHCGTKDYGSLTGNIGAVKAKVVSLFPDLKERLK